jgi:hypothetical protein
MSSIKRDVKKKVPPRPDAEKIFVSISSPLPVSVPPDSLERVRCGLFSISVAFIFRWRRRQSSLKTWQADLVFGCQPWFY